MQIEELLSHQQKIRIRTHEWKLLINQTKASSLSNNINTNLLLFQMANQNPLIKDVSYPYHLILLYL